MKDKVIIEFGRNDIREVKTVWNDAEANALLATGEWIMMHAGCAHIDGMGYNAKPVYILACKSES